MPLTVGIDVFGHCVSCHRNLKVERAVDGKVIEMFTPDHDESEFLLNDGSRMRVCICKKCKEKLLDKDYPKIMQSVKNGWAVEVDNLVKDKERPDWDETRGKKHMDIYNKKEIIIPTENVPDHFVEKKFKEHLESKKE